MTTMDRLSRQLLNRRSFLGNAAAVITTTSLGGQAASSQSPSPAAGTPIFQGGYLATLADGTYFPSTYADGVLPAADQFRPDLLSIFELPLTPEATPLAEIEVANSVTGNPYVMAMSPDGRTLFVCESLGNASEGITMAADLPIGTQVTAIDVSTPASPVNAATAESAPTPLAITVDASGGIVATANQAPGTEITLLAWDGMAFGPAQHVSLVDLGIAPEPGLFAMGLVATCVAWHPTESILAVNLNLRDEVLFLAVTPNGDGTFVVVPWAEPVRVGSDPFTGQFTPDGAHFITSDWGRNFGENIASLEERLPLHPGQVSVIALGDSSPVVVANGISGINPEGLAISPDGSLVVTVNFDGSAFPVEHSRYTPQATLSLFTLDAVSGELAKIDDYGFEGMLPESMAFDTEGTALAVVIFDFEQDEPEGAIEVFEVVRGPDPALVRTGIVIPTPRGVHHLVTFDPAV